MTGAEGGLQTEDRPLPSEKPRGSRLVTMSQAQSAQDSVRLLDLLPAFLCALQAGELPLPLRVVTCRNVRLSGAQSQMLTGEADCTAQQERLSRTGPDHLKHRGSLPRL